MNQRLSSDRTRGGLLVSFACFCAGVLPLSSSGASEVEPPVPPGYKTGDEVKAALASLQVKLINPAEPLPDDVVEEREIEYGKGGARPLLLDLYLPKATPQKLKPGLVFIHGGAWSGGNRQMYRYYTIRFARQGYAAATISYRLSGEAGFPAALEDAKCAVRWMRANAAKYQIDPERIAVIGGSAGGHLSLMVAFTGDHQFAGMGGQGEMSSRVQAVVDFYGPTDLTTDFAQKSRAVKRFLNDREFAEAPDLYKEASPLAYATADDPPTLVLHGTIDDVVPIEQSDRLVEKLRGLKVPVAYERLEGWPHAMDVAEAVNQRCFFAISRFLAEHLRVEHKPAAPAAAPK